MSNDENEAYDPGRLTQSEQEMLRCGEVTPKEAHEILVRFCHSHFHHDANSHDRARISIPADPRRDDDLRLSAFIERAALAFEDREKIRLEATLEERARIYAKLRSMKRFDALESTVAALINTIGEPPPPKYFFIHELIAQVDEMKKRVANIRAGFERLGRELGL